MTTNSRRGRNGLVSIASNIVLDPLARRIYLTKEKLTPEDVIATKFADVLGTNGIKYAIIAGYVAILFGRTRRSDDVDFIIKHIEEDDFVKLIRESASAGFRLMQGNIFSETSIRNVYQNYLMQGYGVRLMLNEQILPNIELKIAATTVHNHAIEKAYEVVINNRYSIKISPLELQIAYKIKLGSDKDLGDALFIYTLFKDALNPAELRKWCTQLSADCSILRG